MRLQPGYLRLHLLQSHLCSSLYKRSEKSKVSATCGGGLESVRFEQMVTIRSGWIFLMRRLNVKEEELH